MKTNLLLLAFVICATCFCFDARAEFLKGPYIQNPTPSSIVVMWQSSEECTGKVLWGKDLSRETPSPANTLHEVTISGLEARHGYPYKVVCGGDTSEVKLFKTSFKGEEPFSFVLFGDTRSDHEQHGRVVNALSRTQVDFIVHTGDIIGAGENEDEWQTYFEIEHNLMAEYPMYFVLGNHDVKGSIEPYLKYLSLPMAQTEDGPTEQYYAFDYGNSRFIIVDTMATVLVEGGAEFNWIIEQLEDAYNDTAIRHIFMFVHEGPYSVKDGRAGNFLLKLVLERFESFKIMAVLSGHDHHYWRGRNARGLDVIVSGGGGAPLYEMVPEDKDSFEFFTGKVSLAYTVFEVNGDTIVGKTLDPDGEVLDSFVWESRQPKPEIEDGDDETPIDGDADDPAETDAEPVIPDGDKETGTEPKPANENEGDAEGCRSVSVAPDIRSAEILFALLLLGWRRRRASVR